MVKIKMTHSYALMEVTKTTYTEIEAKLREAQYDHCFLEDGVIVLPGIGIQEQEIGHTGKITVGEKDPAAVDKFEVLKAAVVAYDTKIQDMAKKAEAGTNWMPDDEADKLYADMMKATDTGWNLDEA